MRTKCLLAAVGILLMVLRTNAAGPGQERIPELRREAPSDAMGTTITGCVARGAAADTFILTNVAKERAILTMGGEERMTVVLSGTSVDLRKHLGHRVAATGSYAIPEPAGTAGIERPVPADVARDSSRPERTFTIKSLKVVSESCTRSA
jgi:hypothetical protein